MAGAARPGRAKLGTLVNECTNRGWCDVPTNITGVTVSLQGKRRTPRPVGKKPGTWVHGYLGAHLVHFAGPAGELGTLVHVEDPVLGGLLYFALSSGAPPRCRGKSWYIGALKTGELWRRNRSCTKT